MNINKRKKKKRKKRRCNYWGKNTKNIWIKSIEMKQSRKRRKDGEKIL